MSVAVAMSIFSMAVPEAEVRIFGQLFEYH